MYTLPIDYTKNIKGYALDVYSKDNVLSEVGTIIQYCKYRKQRHFPQRLVDIAKEKIEKFIKLKFDYIMFIPPTISATQVEYLVVRLADELNTPIKKGLNKMCNTTKKKFCIAQKYQKHKKEKQEIIFSCVECEEIRNKNILLIDDVCYSGHTLRTAITFLLTYKPKMIVPLVLANAAKGNIKHQPVE